MAMIPQKFEKAVIFSEKKILRGRIDDYEPIRHSFEVIFVNLGTKNKESAQTLEIFDLWFFIFQFSYRTLHPRF